MERSRPTTGTGQEEGAESLRGAKGGVESCIKIKTLTPCRPPLSRFHTRAGPSPGPGARGTPWGRGRPWVAEGPSRGLLAATAPPPLPPINNFHSIQKSSFPVCSQRAPYSPARVTESPSVSLCLIPLPGPRWPRARAQGVPGAAAQLGGQRAPVSASGRSCGHRGTTGLRPRGRGPPRSPSASPAPRASSRSVFIAATRRDVTRIYFKDG